jgi:hypothetical protein
MLTEQEIQKALKAARVVPIATANPHGPLGLQQLAAEIAVIRSPGSPTITIPLRAETWAKLQHLAESEVRNGSKVITAADIAAAIVERYVASLPS